jgi:hypothetical protein
MKVSVNSVEEYIVNVPDNYREAVIKLREIVLANLPSGFVEMINYGMIGYVVPHDIYPDGYHCDPKLPLPFMNIASQKNFISFYHMGLYASKEHYNWFLEEYSKVSAKKIDMGKSCIRFKRTEDIPFELLGRLIKKMTVADWIKLYETMKPAKK